MMLLPDTKAVPDPPMLEKIEKSLDYVRENALQRFLTKKYPNYRTLWR